MMWSSLAQNRYWRSETREGVGPITANDKGRVDYVTDELAIQTLQAGKGLPIDDLRVRESQDDGNQEEGLAVRA